MIIFDKSGKVALFERAKELGQWQFPQGGMYQGESPLECMYRELGEETGLNRNQVSVRDELPFLTSYVYPRGLLDSFASSGINYIGQTLRWFVLELHADVTIDLSLASDPELNDVRWVDLPTVVNEIVEFKKQGYQQLVTHLKNTTN